VIRIAITEAACNVIADTCHSAAICTRQIPALVVVGSPGWSATPLTSFNALRQRGEELSDVIVRVAAMEASRPGKRRWRF
jgi:hypothetical protein